jgi:uncharacterized delta-60 repeat protein
MILKTDRFLSLTTIVICTLLVLGIGGAVSPAFAVSEVTINNGLPVTNYRQVSLIIVPPAGSATMSLRNEAGTWSTEEAVTPLTPVTKPWTLSAPDGDKTVSVQFRTSSAADNGTFSDTIKLDYIIDTGFYYPKGSTNFANGDLPGLNKTAGRAVAVQADQKLVVVGTFDKGNGDSQLAIIRYNTDGSYDNTFGGGSGKVLYGKINRAGSGGCVAIQPDGKIVVVGTEEISPGKTGLWLLRLTSTGEPDPAFNTALGAGSYIILGGLGLNTGNAVAIQRGTLPDHSDDKIVVVGTYDKGGANGTFPWVLRFDMAGNPDSGWGGYNGIVMNVAAGAHAGNAVAIQPGTLPGQSDDKIVITGTYDQGAGNSSVWVLQLTNSGQLDTTFGRPTTGNPSIKLGYDTFGYPGKHSGNGVAINPTTGKISVVGTYGWSSADTDVWLLQLNSDGTLDSTFNPTGTGNAPLLGTVALGGTGADTGRSVVIDALGRTLVVGTYDNGSPNTSLLVQRITSAGTYDTTFNRGNQAYSFGIPGKFEGWGVALQADGKIAVTGMGDGISDNHIGTSSILTLRLYASTWPLAITTVGSGTVDASLGDIAWVGSTGSGTYLPGTLVQLTAVPVGGATFTGWSGDCTGSGACSVTMDGARNVTANYTLTYALNASVTGVGTVTSAPGTISCNSVSGLGCSDSFLAGTPVTLTATPTWYTLSGFWSGGSCSGSIATPCTVTLNQVRTVNATFISNLNARCVGWGDYPTLLQAYSMAYESGAAATIQAKDSAQVVFQEAPLNFNLPVTVTLQGGKGSDFSAAAVGFTSVIGPLNISSGRLNASYLKVKHP